MNVDSSTEFDTETPMHMIEPMNDSMFKLVPVSSRIVGHAEDYARHAAERNQRHA